MAAQPIMQKLEAEVARQGGDEAIFGRYRAGESPEEIMASYGLSRTMFYQWVHKSDEREAEWDRSKKDRGHTMVDQALEIVDDPALATAPTSAEVQRAKMRSDFRMKLASKLNRAEFGDDALVNIHNQITTGDLHLDALLKHGLAAKATGEIREADYELITGETAEPDAATLFDDEEDSWEDDS